MEDFKDYFSKQSAAYALYRPDYPEELIDFILSQTKQKQVAWDCATGTGQVAQSLAARFGHVFASDASAAQIQKASRDPHISYRVATAENSGLDDHSVDLITVAQAIHWFDHTRFYEEVKRVARPGAFLAIWGYGLLRINKRVDPILDELYYQVLGQTYWPPERKHIDEAYAQLPFPFQRVKVPHFRLQKIWDLEELSGYIHTWSASQRYQEASQESPLKPIGQSLLSAWGDPKEKKIIHWPILERMAIL